jgi:hypothetical protein
MTYQTATHWTSLKLSERVLPGMLDTRVVDYSFIQFIVDLNIFRVHVSEEVILVKCKYFVLALYQKI